MPRRPRCVGYRCWRRERFAMRATVPGISDAILSQLVEVPTRRPQFTAAIGGGGRRPDLVVRFGRRPTMPRSLRRPLQAVLI